MMVLAWRKTLSISLREFPEKMKLIAGNRPFSIGSELLKPREVSFHAKPQQSKYERVVYIKNSDSLQKRLIKLLAKSGFPLIVRQTERAYIILDAFDGNFFTGRLPLQGDIFSLTPEKFKTFFHMQKDSAYAVHVSALFQKEDPWKKVICLR